MGVMDDRIDGVVLFDIDESNNTTLTARSGNRWIHVSAEECSFEKSTQFKEVYKSLADAAKTELTAEEPGEEENEQPRTSAKQTKDSSSSNDEQSDSGYASVDDNEEEPSETESYDPDAKEELQGWLLNPVLGEPSQLETSSIRDPLTLADWYITEIHAFKIKAESEYKLVAEEDKDFDGSKFILQNLIPCTNLPKYLRKLPGVSWYSPHDVQVCRTCHDIHHPIHPTLVKVISEDSIKEDIGSAPSKQSEFFFKLATEDSYEAVTRELRILHQLKKNNLINETAAGVRAPSLEGLVASPTAAAGSQTKIIGFLLTDIPAPTRPLVELMSIEIEQETRDYWAQESERMIKVLHDSDIVWGDAKADNFIVDKENKLWIIDFGGSYTEGWVDPEQMETKEGDDEAAAKIVDATRDPDDADGEPNESQDEEYSPNDNVKDAKTPNKRVREEEDEDYSSTKKSRMND